MMNVKQAEEAEEALFEGGVFGTALTEEIARIRGEFREFLEAEYLKVFVFDDGKDEIYRMALAQGLEKGYNAIEDAYIMFASLANTLLENTDGR